MRRKFLLLAAADVSDDLGHGRRAAPEAGIDAEAAGKAAESAGLIEVSGSFVRFRLASVVRQKQQRRDTPLLPLSGRDVSSH